MLGFGVFATAKSMEIRVIILRGTYNIEKIRIRKILFLIPLISLQYDTWAESYGQNTMTCVEREI
jgi:hypothetical protein